VNKISSVSSDSVMSSDSVIVWKLRFYWTKLSFLSNCLREIAEKRRRVNQMRCGASFPLRRGRPFCGLENSICKQFQFREAIGTTLVHFRRRFLCTQQSLSPSFPKTRCACPLLKARWLGAKAFPIQLSLFFAPLPITCRARSLESKGKIDP
jgi:hypothetical protein